MTTEQMTVDNLSNVRDVAEQYSTTVMIVDDSVTIRKVIARILGRHGMATILAKDGVDALALLQEHQPDIMLSDDAMPHMDGLELVRQMCNSDDPRIRRIPIIMWKSLIRGVELAYSLGVKHVLSMPVNESELLDCIYAVLAERVRLN